MSDDRWDDARLDGAFADRYGTVAPPADLVDAVTMVLRRDAPTARRGGLRLAWLGSAAAASIVVAVVALTAGIPPPGRVEQPPATGASASPPGATSDVPVPASSGGEHLPLSVISGLRAITVSDALAVRDGGADDTEIAVRGWEPPMPVPSCPYSPRLTPIERQCGDFGLLTETWQRLGSETESSMTTVAPTGPALPLLFRPPGPRRITVAPPAPGWPGGGVLPSGSGDAQPLDRFEPVEVVLVGHFADYRSSLCRDPAACRREFVVDARVRLDGGPLDDTLVHSHDGRREPRLDHVHVRAAVESHTSPRTHLATGLFDAQSVIDVDPRVAGAALRDAPLVWVVRQLEDRSGDAVARTYLVDDVTGAVYRSDAKGVAAIGPSPMTVTLADGVAAVIHDDAGGLVDASAIDPRTVPDDGPVIDDAGVASVYLAQAQPDQLRIQWSGSPCDSTWSVRIRDARPTVVLDHPPIEGCAAVPVDRAIELTFDRPFDLGEVVVGYDTPYHP